MRELPADLRLHLVAAMNEPLPAQTGDDPLDVILGDHYRMRAMLNLIQHLARNRVTPRVREILARVVLSFLEIDYERHLLDEEKFLFPLLAQRLTPSDLLDPSLRQLTAEHRESRDAAALLADEASRLQRFPKLLPSRRFRDCAEAFARAKQRHIAAENALVIPLARERLARRDLHALARGLAANRARRPLPPAWPLGPVVAC
jgi:hemerythrin-like domain-containing protein